MSANRSSICWEMTVAFPRCTLAMVMVTPGSSSGRFKSLAGREERIIVRHSPGLSVTWATCAERPGVPRLPPTTGASRGERGESLPACEQLLTSSSGKFDGSVLIIRSLECLRENAGGEAIRGKFLSSRRHIHAPGLTSQNFSYRNISHLLQTVRWDFASDHAQARAVIVFTGKVRAIMGTSLMERALTSGALPPLGIAPAAPLSFLSRSARWRRTYFCPT